MIKSIISILLLLLFSNAGAAKQYAYTDKYIEVTVESQKDAYGIETIVLKLKPLVQILVPDNDGCFELDTVHTMRCNFRNIYCPLFLLNDCVNTGSVYRVIPKNALLTYKWQASGNKPLHAFSFDIEYIPTTTKEYAAKRKNFEKRAPESARKRISIRPGDDTELIKKVHDSIVIE